MNTAPDGTDTAQVLVVDDNPTMRAAIAIILGDEQDLSACGEAESIAEALELCKTQPPDLVLIDISLRGENGLDLVTQLKEHYPRVLTVVFSLHDDPNHIEGAREVGAHGYASKGDGVDALLGCVRSVLKGERCFAHTRPI